VRRHLEGAHLEQAAAAGRAVSGEYSLSMQNSARWVLPVASTSRLRKTRSTSQGGVWLVWGGLDLAEGDLELVQRVVARLVDARMPGWSGR
jgi:hypothetical protein